MHASLCPNAINKSGAEACGARAPDRDRPETEAHDHLTDLLHLCSLSLVGLDGGRHRGHVDAYYK